MISDNISTKNSYSLATNAKFIKIFPSGKFFVDTSKIQPETNMTVSVIVGYQNISSPPFNVSIYQGYTVNFPPFIDSNSEKWIIDLGKTNLTNSLRYKFPNLIDNEGDKITIQPQNEQKGWTVIEDGGKFFLEVTGETIEKMGTQKQTLYFMISDNISTTTNSFEL